MTTTSDHVNTSPRNDYKFTPYQLRRVDTLTTSIKETWDEFVAIQSQSRVQVSTPKINPDDFLESIITDVAGIVLSIPGVRSRIEGVAYNQPTDIFDVSKSDYPTDVPYDFIIELAMKAIREDRAAKSNE
jgi:hypothetical protein